MWLKVIVPGVGVPATTSDCEAALVGGVNLSLHASKYHLLQDMKVLSPDGHERTFDDAANGLVPSEGAGVVGAGYEPNTHQRADPAMDHR